MKIADVSTNNRKRVFQVRAGKRTLDFPFARLRRAPSRENPVAEVFSDPELGHEAFTYRLADGTEDSVHLDAVLEYNEDPGITRELLLHRLTLEANERLEASGLPRREVIRRLGTSASQFYRLLDAGNKTKSIGQLLDLFHVLGCDVEIRVTNRRRRRSA